MDDTELLAAIGRIVVQAALLDYSVATLVATCEGLRGEACEARAAAIVRTAGKAMGLFERLAKQRPDLAWLMNDTKLMFGARNFVAHSVAQQDAISDGEAALFILDPRTGESMITTRQARNNVRLISEGVARIQAAIAAEMSGGQESPQR